MGLGSARSRRRTGNSYSGNERYGQRLIAIKKVELAAKDIAAQVIESVKIEISTVRREAQRPIIGFLRL
jgi:hypothetical protein